MSPQKTYRDAEQILQQFFHNLNTNTDEKAGVLPSTRNTTLNLSSCNLNELPRSFETLMQANPKRSSQIKLLNLAHNNLTTLPNYLTNLCNLNILFLLNNKFKSIPSVIRRIPSITMLSFKQNSLHGQLQASELPSNLEWLILTCNQLQSLSEDFPLVCNNVRKLMLSNNQLSTLPQSFAKYMTELELLRLANNSFSSFPIPQLLPLQNLKWLAFSANPCIKQIKNVFDELPSHLYISNLDDRFHIEWDSNPIGSGTSGNIYQGVDKKNPEIEIVVKKFQSFESSDGTSIDEIYISCLTPGIPNIVQTIAYSKDQQDSNQYYLVTEKVRGDPMALAGPPSFETCVRSVYKNDLIMNHTDKQNVIQCITKAVNQLHQRGICHGDVYAHNILISKPREHDVMSATLVDFGASWLIPNHVDDNFKQQVKQMELRSLQVFIDEINDLPER